MKQNMIKKLIIIIITTILEKLKKNICRGKSVWQHLASVI